jgi:uncharacterized protein (TIGR02678 family)
MIAQGVRDTDLTDYQRTVRTLLVHPLVTATSPDRTTLTNVRRFLEPLTADLEAIADYRLELTATCARLVRRVDRPDPTQVVRRRDGTAFDRRRYAYLALVLGVLGRSGVQVALTELAASLRRRAGEIADLTFDPDVYRHRLAFVDVVRYLLGLDVLQQVEVSNDWLRDPDAGEALYDVDRDVLHQVVVAPRVLQHVRSAGALLADDGLADLVASSRDTRRSQVRKRLCRLLLEHPVVHLDDLDEAARTYLASQGRVLADDLHRLTGAQLERRAEGLALIDTTGGFSDRRFPTGGTAAQVALLLADRVAAAVENGEVPSTRVPTADELRDAVLARLDAARPTPTDAAADDPLADDVMTGRAAPPGQDPLVSQAQARTAPTGREPYVDQTQDPSSGPLLTDTWLRSRSEELIARHGRTFAAELRDDPVALAEAAVAVLESFDLVRRVSGGVVARPAIARYRDVTVDVRLQQPDLLSGQEAPS